MTSEVLNKIFNECTADYHVKDNVDAPIQNPYPTQDVKHLFYQKNWIDNLQWHLEDIVRDPNIEPVKALGIKRRIDRLNQERTDTVEQIDQYFLLQYNNVTALPTATLNTESPAWAIDRLSILALKIFHMKAETERKGASSEHRLTCHQKLAVLLEQQKDLSLAIDRLIDDIAAGKVKMKVYKQMKMYNDPSLNPVLYQQQTSEANGS
ncbi:MAG TPA: DUF4254 domain-containing protein [Chitinophagaceae bacterium]|nr:DUF4254 domain-containing protein [Chitinophagaceae bacterium]